MTNANIIRALNITGAIAATIGGASVIPDLGLPKVVLAYGLLLAGICTAVKSELLQVKGQSDETQGIAPPAPVVMSGNIPLPPTTSASAPIQVSATNAAPQAPVQTVGVATLK